MKALVVYESMYGNTAAIGNAIAASLRARGLDVEAGLVSKIDPAKASEADLVLVGGPTHIHGMSSVASRKKAADDEKNTFAEPTIQPGLRDWIKRTSPGPARLAAAFDTRIDKPVIVTGSAAKGIGRRLKGRGFRLVCDPECFLVSTANLLIDGETDRATAWAAALVDRASPA